MRAISQTIVGPWEMREFCRRTQLDCRSVIFAQQCDLVCLIECYLCVLFHILPYQYWLSAPEDIRTDVLELVCQGLPPHGNTLPRILVQRGSFNVIKAQFPGSCTTRLR